MFHMCVEGSTDPQQQLQQQQDDISSLTSSSSSLCLHTVVMVTVPLCVVVLLTLAAIIALYALSARRRRCMMSSPAAATPFPLPVSSGCRCGDVERHSWLMSCGGCATHRPMAVTDHRRKSVEHHPQIPHRHRHQLVVESPDPRYSDARRPDIVAPTSPSVIEDRPPPKPTSNHHSESTLLLVARDAWTS